MLRFAGVVVAVAPNADPVYVIDRLLNITVAVALLIVSVPGALVTA